MTRFFEAFSILTYKCDHCFEVIAAWNSRDGATPSEMMCRFCDGKMTHSSRMLTGARTFEDFKACVNIAEKRKYVFIDCSIEKAKELALVNYEHWSYEITIPKDEFLKNKEAEIYGNGHAPLLIKFSEYENEREE